MPALSWFKLLAEMLLVVVVTLAIEFSGMVREVSSFRRGLTFGIAVFLVLLVFHLLWP